MSESPHKDRSIRMCVSDLKQLGTHFIKSTQFNFVYLAFFTIGIVSRSFTEPKT